MVLRQNNCIAKFINQAILFTIVSTKLNPLEIAKSSDKPVKAVYLKTI